VFVNGELIARLDRRRGQNTVKLPVLEKNAQLDILVEAMGRVNFGEAILDWKGITEKVELIDKKGTKALKNWQVFNLSVDYDFVKNKKFAKNKESVTAPAYYRTTFIIDKPGDVFLDMQTWSKGMVWVNGIAIGRFWEIGPQQTLFMPGCWLKEGENEIIVLDLKGPEQTIIKGLKQPILAMLRPEAAYTHRNKGETLELTNESSVYDNSFAAGNGWKEVDLGKTYKARYVCIEALSPYKEGDNASIAELYVTGANGKPLSRQSWKIVYADSENTRSGNHTADKVFDLQESTYWSTPSGVDYPHQIVIDLGKIEEIRGFRYLPRVEEGAPGLIKDYKLYLKEEPFIIK
jgi:beta-galactosidase